MILNINIYETFAKSSKTVFKSCKKIAITMMN